MSESEDKVVPKDYDVSCEECDYCHRTSVKVISFWTIGIDWSSRACEQCLSKFFAEA